MDWSGGAVAAHAIGGIGGITANAIIDGVRAIVHSNTEATLSLGQYHQGVNAAREAFLKTFGQDEYEGYRMQASVWVQV